MDATWKVTTNPLFPHLVITIGDRSFGAKYFTAPFDTYTPADIERVEVVETWRGGGRAVIHYQNSDTETVIFGRAKPGSKAGRSWPYGGFNRRRQAGRRAAFEREGAAVGNEGEEVKSCLSKK